jgi:hypothetical protein
VLGLQLGDTIKCKVCGGEHEVKGSKGAQTDSTKAMLYVFCAKPRPGLYYIGTIGGESNRGPIVRRAKRKIAP